MMPTIEPIEIPPVFHQEMVTPPEMMVAPPEVEVPPIPQPEPEAVAPRPDYDGRFSEHLVPSFDDLVARLMRSSFGYSVPEETNIDDAFDVKMVINPMKTEGQIRQSLDGGQQLVGTVLISKVVQAKLVADDFEVVALTPERQAVDLNQDTTWVWSLSPEAAGAKKIRITITAIVTVDGERFERHIETYNGEVEVKITRKQRIERWLSKNWQWAWGALLIPALGWFMARRRKKLDKDQKNGNK